MNHESHPNIVVTSLSPMAKAVLITVNAAYAYQQKYRTSALKALRDTAHAQYYYLEGRKKMPFTYTRYLDLICSAAADEISLPCDLPYLILKYYDGMHYAPAPDEFVKRAKAEWSIYKENAQRLENAAESLRSQIDELLPLSPAAQNMLDFLTDRQNCYDLQTICRYVYTIARKEITA